MRYRLKMLALVLALPAAPQTPAKERFTRIAPERDSLRSYDRRSDHVDETVDCNDASAAN